MDGNNNEAEIIADSLSPTGYRLTSFVVRFPRIVLAEFNTHRGFCLSGDTVLSFDLPNAVKKNQSCLYEITIKDFYKKWAKGAKKRPRHSYKVFLDNSKVYTAKEISLLSRKGVSNIRSRCRDGSIKVENPNKKRSEDFLIKGSNYNDYHNSLESHGCNLRERLSKMSIRQLNEGNNHIIHSNVKDCIFSGVKKVFKITLKNGKSLKCSKDHRIFTSSGWKKLEDIKIGDFVISQKVGVEEKKDPLRFKKINGRWVTVFLKNIRKKVAEKQNKICNYCDNLFKDLHHLKPVHKYPELAFEESNIVGVCEPCHKKEHKQREWQMNLKLLGENSEVMSIEYVGEEETYDLEIGGEFPNFLANGIVVHNSRNSASSRAIPFSTMLRNVYENPFVPFKFQKSHSGMQGNEYWEGADYEIAKSFWLESAKSAADKAAQFAFLDKNITAPQALALTPKELKEAELITKQLSNRQLEPYLWHTVLITATCFENFFSLRAEGAAEIHIQDLAYKMLDVYNNSKPKELEYGEWHTPFGGRLDQERLKEICQRYKIELWEGKVRIAVARAARVSYLNYEGTDDYDKDFKLFESLKKMGHASPFEHCAKASIIKEPRYISNFKGDWLQFRKLIPNENRSDSRVKKWKRL